MFSKEELLATGYFVKGKYFDEYIELLLKNTETKYLQSTTNAHHIIPRHYFKHLNIPVDNSSKNIVNLSHKDHAIAHLLLSGCTTGRDRYWNLYSVFYMTGQRHFDSIDEYRQLIDDYPELYENAIKAAPNHRKGTKCSESTRRKMSQSKKGTVTNKGYVWLHNTIDERMVPANSVQDYLNEGFVLGRIYRHNEDTLHKIASASTGPRSPEFCEKMRQIALHQPPHTDEQKMKISMKLKEYHKTHNNSFLGKHHSEESRKKMSDALKHKVTINDGYKTIRVMDYNLQKYLDDGWKLGKRN